MSGQGGGHDGRAGSDETEFLRLWTEAFGAKGGSRADRVDRIDGFRRQLDALWARLSLPARRRRRHELEGLERLRQAIVAGMSADELDAWGGNPRPHRQAQAFTQHPDGSFAIDTADGTFTWRENPDGTFTETDPQGNVTVLSLDDVGDAGDAGTAPGPSGDIGDELDDRD